jgi:hypothetical protein
MMMENEALTVIVPDVMTETAPEVEAAAAPDRLREVPVEEFGVGMLRLLKDGLCGVAAVGRGEVPPLIKTGVSAIGATIGKASRGVGDMLHRFAPAAKE